MGLHHGKRSTGNSSTGYTKRSVTSPAPSELYSFTSFTFNTGGQTGHTGGTLAQFKGNYDTSTYSWLNDTSFFNVTTNGFQQWTVPSTGSYQFVVTGAGGGQGGRESNNNDTVTAGKGAKLTFTRTLTQSDVLYIAVGHAGESGASSASCGLGAGAGGGGTFIYDNTNSQLIAVAGGGGGAGNDTAASSNYQPDGRTNSNDGGSADGIIAVPGGTNGLGGTSANVTTYGCVNGGPGGGGYAGDGVAYNNTDARRGVVGNGYNNSTAPLKGGDADGSNSGGIEDGGFGGGGSSGYYCGGGGGGYSGGAGGGLPTCNCSNLSGGGGGGSYYIGGLGTITTAVDTSFQQAGSVVVTKV